VATALCGDDRLYLYYNTIFIDVNKISKKRIKNVYKTKQLSIFLIYTNINLDYRFLLIISRLSLKYSYSCEEINVQHVLISCYNYYMFDIEPHSII
jgi:hypothetical protein